MSVIQIADGYLFQLCMIAQRGIKRKADVIPDCDVSRRAALLREMGAFEIAEVADVMHREITPRVEQRRIGRAGQRRAFGKERIEDDAAAGFRLAPDAEMPRELVPQNVAGRSVRLDGEPDGGGCASVRGAANAASELLAKHAADQRQFTAAARHVKGFKALFAALSITGAAGSEAVRGKQVFRRVQGFFHERAATVIKVVDGNRHLGPAGTHVVQVDHNAPCVGMQALFLLAALFVQAEHLSLREAVLLDDADSRFFERQSGEYLIKTVSAERWDSFGRNNNVLARVQFDERGIKRSAAKVVNQDVHLFAELVRGAFVMAEFDAGGRRLI